MVKQERSRRATTKEDTMHYKGFELWQSGDGIWHAVRFGVTVCNGTKEGLKVVIDLHIADREAAWKRLAEPIEEEGGPNA